MANRKRKTDIGLPYESRCLICTSPIKDRVNRLAAAGFGHSDIADEVIGLDPKLSKNRSTLRKNIERHVNRHLKLKEAAIRQILENRAKEEGILLNEFKGQFTSDQGLLDLMVAKGQDQITDPNSKIAYRDVLEAIRIKKEMDMNSFSIQSEIMNRQISSIAQAVKELVPPDLYPRVIERARNIFEAKEMGMDAPKVIAQAELEM